MRYIFFALLLLSVSATGSFAQKRSDNLDWKDGMILDNQYKNGVIMSEGPDMTTPNSNGTKTSYIRDDKETITVEGEDNIFIVRRRLALIWEKRIKLSDPKNVKYALRDNMFYLQNYKGNKVTYEIVEKKTKIMTIGPVARGPAADRDVYHRTLPDRSIVGYVC